MSGIDDLQQRVVDAESRFGLINEQHAKYSERLIALMNAIEGRILEQQDTIERQAADLARQTEAVGAQEAEVARQAVENEQLRAMLHSLLRAIEADSRDVLAEAMQELESKVSILVGGRVLETPDESPTADHVAVEPEASGTEEVPAAADIAAEDDAPAIEDAPVADETSETAASDEAAEAEPEHEAPDEPKAVPETAESPSASLAEIMARVSRLVEESEEVGFAEDSGAPAAAPTVDETATVADDDPAAAAI